ncbi:hypothetical protein GGS21DRAFT_520310 [Xylaria nigripes]|nr:hypothetical protein GGS21DRAFT_520310 [Xylaria nigripes]
MYGEREGRCHFASYAQFMEQFRAYTQLQPVQGICIPQLYGTVAYTFPSPYVNEPIKYFQAPGLLSEMIAGFCLSDLLLELPDADIMIWQDIIQRAVDCITEVNLHGVIIHDCTPKNMLVSMVEEQATKVLLVRFEHVSIESQYREECRKRQDSPASSNDCKCWDCLISAAGNPVTIGSAMVEKVKEVTGHDLKVTYRRRYDYMGVGWTIVDNRQPEGPDGLCEKISRGVATAGDWGRDTFLAVSRWFRAQKVKAAQSNNNDANTDDNGGQLAPGV